MATELRVDPSLRQRQILEMVGTRGFVPIDELARHFRLTSQTIRSDVNRLSREGLLRRYHGGVGLISTLDNATFAKRRVLHSQQKIRIARLLAEHVPANASVSLHYGTTMQAVAAALRKHTGLLIVTNNISAVSAAEPRNGLQLLLAGGKVNMTEQCTLGEAATGFFSQFYVDFGILSVGAIGADGSLYEFNYEAAETARAIMRNSKQVFLASDRQKFERKGLIKVGHLRDVSALFTDRAPPTPIVQLLKGRGISLHIA